MTVTVVPIFEPDVKPALPLAKVMNERLKRMAAELEGLHLKDLKSMEPMFEDVVIYISYNSKYNIRWKVVNDVSADVTSFVSAQCDKLGYIKWKEISLYNFNGRS